MNAADTPVGVRWTLGDVSDRGFEALRLSVWGAFRVFGPEAAYVVCVNSIPAGQARGRTGDLPRSVQWQDASGQVPPFLQAHMDAGMAQGVGWKLAPLRVFPDRYEISLDNDCILWAMPEAIRRWLAGAAPDRCVMAEDVSACFGQFEAYCGVEPRNSGIRGLPPGFDLGRALDDVLAKRQRELGHPVAMTSELDEQGLQTAALSRSGPPLVVTLDEVTICSPFWPHLGHLGRCGAHFVGLNARHIPWDYFDRPADAWESEHWQRHRLDLYERVGLALEGG